MPIPIQCACGASWLADLADGGEVVLCPQCGAAAALRAPPTEIVAELAEPPSAAVARPAKSNLRKLIVNTVMVLVALIGLTAASVLIIQDRLRRANQVPGPDEDLAAAALNDLPLPQPPPAGPVANQPTSDRSGTPKPLPPNTLGHIPPNSRVTFRQVPASRGVLVGLEIDIALETASNRVRRLRSIFHTASGRIVSESALLAQQQSEEPISTIRLEAQEGYAVGAVEGRYDNRLEGLRLIFMRQQGDRLDANDAYASRWVGTWNTANSLQRVDSKGLPVVGVAGTGNFDWDSLELILADAPAP